MAVTLHLARHGRKGVPFYRIVASERGAKRDGKFIEMLGTYSTLTSPAAVTLKEDRIRHWITNGAQTSRLMRDVIKKNIPGLIDDRITHQRKKIQAARKKRKARLKSKKK